MPDDRLLYPRDQSIDPSSDPVEMAKRIMDYRDIKYRGDYLPNDDTYVITVMSKRPMPDGMFQSIRALGFRNTGKRKFFYKRYSVIAQAKAQPEPIYGNGTFDSQPMNPAPDPFYNNYNV